MAFNALSATSATAADRDAGIEAFCAQNDGDGWLLPDTLRLSDHHLGRAADPQPCATALGPRFLDWQLNQNPEESWAECERHARAILGDAAFEERFGSPLPVVEESREPGPTVGATTVSPAPAPLSLIAPRQQSLFKPSE